MPKKTIDLLTRNDEEIIGVVLSNGDIDNISYTFDSKTRLLLCIVPDGSLKDSSHFTFLLENGNRVTDDLEAILSHSLDRWLEI